jgi:hypothetical protein
LGEHGRNRLIRRSGFDVLPHRSQECSPCVNANSQDFKLLSEIEICRVEELEAIVGKNMFRAKKHQGANGIREVIKWAHLVRKNPTQDEFEFCIHGMCGH